MAASFLGKVEQSRKGNIHLLRCQDLQNRDCYYVLQCPKARLHIILKSPADIEDLSSHATILAKGFGHEPGETVWNMLETRYGLKRKDFS